LYKVISNIIAIKIKKFLSKGIPKEKFGLLENKQINEAIGITQEALHSIKNKKSKYFILKLYLIKAYDRIDWSFLRLVLFQMGSAWKGLIA